MKIIEAGHYYSAKGPTKWSAVSWEILKNIKAKKDKTVLFIDDVHSIEDVSGEELDLPILNFKPSTDYLIMESSVKDEALKVLDILKGLPRKAKAKKGKDGKWFCSGFSITDHDCFPSCVLLDAGLTLKKQSLGFKEGVNILPFFYEEEQRNLLRLVKKAIPDFSLKVILYDLDGKYWEMC